MQTKEKKSKRKFKILKFLSGIGLDEVEDDFVFMFTQIKTPPLRLKDQFLEMTDQEFAKHIDLIFQFKLFNLILIVSHDLTTALFQNALRQIHISVNQIAGDNLVINKEGLEYAHLIMSSKIDRIYHPYKIFNSAEKVEFNNYYKTLVRLINTLNKNTDEIKVRDKLREFFFTSSMHIKYLYKAKYKTKSNHHFEKFMLSFILPNEDVYKFLTKSSGTRVDAENDRENAKLINFKRVLTRYFKNNPQKHPYFRPKKFK